MNNAAGPSPQPSGKSVSSIKEVRISKRTPQLAQTGTRPAESGAVSGQFRTLQATQYMPSKDEREQIIRYPN